MAVLALGHAAAQAAEPAAVAPPAAYAELSSLYAQRFGIVEVLQLRPDIYLLTVEGMNVVLHTGPDGAVVVNPGPAQTADAVVAAIRALSKTPVRYLVNTSAGARLTGANQKVAEAGRAFVATQIGWAAPTISHENTMLSLNSLRRPEQAGSAFPSAIFTRPQYTFYLNGQGIEVKSHPAAHSNGDTSVRFPRSDVVVTGEIFDNTRFPVINVAAGGSMQGVVDALNELINLRTSTPLPVVSDEGGTLVVPVRGPVSSQTDLVAYRAMVMTVQMRIQDLIDRGQTLAQVKAANPLQGYETRYGATRGDWTNEQFVEAVYQSLTKKTN